MTRVLVIGGGLSGLACAHALARGGADVQVLEAAERVGGVCGTHEQDGFRFELGPNTVQASSAALRTLCGELGIADRLIASNASARLRFLHHKGKLRALPSAPPSILTTSLLPLGARLKLLSEGFRRSPWKKDADPEPTFAAFLEERIGRHPTRLFAAAFVRGIYAGDIDALGARSAFPRLWDLAAEHGGILRGMMKRPKAGPLPGPDVRGSRLLSFPRGLQELVDALDRELGDRAHRSLPARSLCREGDTWSVETASGRLTADQVVLAVPAHVAAELLGTLPAPPAGAAHLAAVRASSVTTVHLGYGPEAEPGFADANGFPPGFGYLVPPDERGHGVPEVLGTIFVSNLFEGRAPEGGLAVTSFYAGEKLEGMKEHTIVRNAEKDLARALRLGELPRSRTSFVRAWQRAIPQYTVGHAERMAALEDELRATLPGLRLAGNYVGGVGVEQVIARGRTVAAAALGRAAEAPTQAAS